MSSLCSVLGGGLIVVYVVVGCCWFVFGVEGRVRVVNCVCATEPPQIRQIRKNTDSKANLPLLEALYLKSLSSTVRSDLSPRHALESRSPPPFDVSSRMHV